MTAAVRRRHAEDSSTSTGPPSEPPDSQPGAVSLRHGAPHHRAAILHSRVPSRFILNPETILGGIDSATRPRSLRTGNPTLAAPSWNGDREVELDAKLDKFRVDTLGEQGVANQVHAVEHRRSSLAEAVD